MALTGLAGAVGIGAFEYVSDLRERLPQGDLRALPADAEWEARPVRGMILRIPAAVVSVAVAVGFGFDELDRYVAYRHDGGEIQRFAVHPLALLARR